jgi:Proteobacterial transcriptional regulator-like domain
MPKPDWRSAAAYDYVRGLTLPNLAWEFLRRNPDYRGDYEAALTAGSQEGETILGSCWGLRFRRRSGHER